jgi:hypothetical protein
VDGVEHVCFSSTIRPSENRYILGKGVSSVAVTAEINQRKAFEFHLCKDRTVLSKLKIWNQVISPQNRASHEIASNF